MPDSDYKPAVGASAIDSSKRRRIEGRTEMTYNKEEQGDENEFVHFEEELGGDPEEIIEEEGEEELVITERPGAAASTQSPPAGRKPAAKKTPAKKSKKPPVSRSQKAKAARPAQESRS